MTFDGQKRMAVYVGAFAVLPALLAATDAVKVRFTFYEPSLTPVAIRIGDECFFPVEAASRLGWSVTQRGDRVTVRDAAAETTLPIRRIGGAAYASLSKAVQAFGAVGTWKNAGTFEVLAAVKSIVVAQGQITVETSLPVQPNTFVLDAPPRLVMDLRGAVLTPSNPPKVEGAVRYSQFQPDIVRVVVDLSTAPRLAAKPSTGRSLVASWSSASPVAGAGRARPLQVKSVELAAETDGETILRIPYQGPRPTQVTTARDGNGVVWVRLPNAVREEDGEVGTALSSTVLTSANLERTPWGDLGVRLEMRRPMGVIVSPSETELVVRIVRPRYSSLSLSSATLFVDAGHGGKDTGTQFTLPDGTVVREKEIVLPIAQMVSQKLSSDGATTILTRDGDFDPGLYARAEMANSSGAHFFLSIHVNSNKVVDSMSGTFVYYHDNDIDSKVLADCIAAEIGKVSGLPNHGARSDYTLYPNKGLAVLRTANMPAVLIEVAYLNHAKDRQLLMQPEFRNRIAEAIVKGLKVYLGVDT
ncbi:MAG: hypothetical protein C4341_01370 [Armatimonadota bacterium]